MKIGRKYKNEDMGVIWKNTLKASDQSDAEKMLAYAKEHYKERGLEDFDEQSMGGLEFTEDRLIYTEVVEEKLIAFYRFADEISAVFPEMELSLLQVGDDNYATEYIYKNGICTRLEMRMLELLAADEADGKKLIETAVPIIESAGYQVEANGHDSVSFTCDAKSCEEFKDHLAEQITGLMPDSRLLCLVHDLGALEFTVDEYCILNGHKGEWESPDEVMFYLAAAACGDGSVFSMYDVILNPTECFRELQKELRSGTYYNSYTAQFMIFAETPYRNQLIDLLAPEDKDWIMDEGRVSVDVSQTRYYLCLKSSDDEIQKVLDEIFAKCGIF